MFVSRSTIVQAGLCLFLFIGFASAQPHWALTSISGPAPRFVHGMAYDSCRDVVVLYGGTIDNSGQAYQDTWEWNGQAWSQKATIGPTARRQFGMAFDANRCRTVLFGGNDAPGAYFNETWEYNGTTSTWTQMLPGTSPSARSGPALAFDSTRNLIVLFGGYQPGHVNDTWTWNGMSWTQLTTTTPPSARTNVGMTYDSARDRMIIFGGTSVASCAGPFLDQTWELDMSTGPATWTQVSTTSKPSPRQPARVVYDPVRARTILFGGNLGCGGDSDETWEFNGAVPSWTFVDTTGPSARQSHDMVYDETRNEVLIFGGVRIDGTPIGETWSYGNRAHSIPALGTWGLATTMLLLLCAGTLVATRRRVAGRMT